jgi:hypothetical protein
MYPSNQGGQPYHIVGAQKLRCAKQQNRWAKGSNGSWLCKNVSARGAHRKITRKLRLMESNHAVRAQLDDVFENCIFYILPMYEFSHSLGQTLPN